MLINYHKISFIKSQISADPIHLDSNCNVEYKYNLLDCFGCNWNCIYDYPKCMDVDINVNINK